MDNRRAELENLLRDNRELEDQCGHLQEWLGDYSRRLIDSLLVTWCSLPHHAFASALGTKAGTNSSMFLERIFTNYFLIDFDEGLQFSLVKKFQ